MIERRLGEIDGMLITKGYSEKHLSRTIQDPGAYAHSINRLLGEEYGSEVEALEIRLAELRAIAPEAPAHDGEAG